MKKHALILQGVVCVGIFAIPFIQNESLKFGLNAGLGVPAILAIFFVARYLDDKKPF